MSATPGSQERVRVRLAVMDAQAQERVEQVHARIGPHLKSIGQRLNAALHGPGSSDEKFRALYRLADEFTSYAAPFAACQRGCSHCCHIGVEVGRAEAYAIGRAIGVKPAKPTTVMKVWRGPKAREQRDAELAAFDWGYHNPCTFLKDGECSIYEHRPLVCRTYLNMDIDALMCELDPPNLRPVARLNTEGFHEAAAVICAQLGPSVAYGDIREFFPHGKGAKA